jgi:hypothetical protein
MVDHHFWLTDVQFMRYSLCYQTNRAVSHASMTAE